MLLVHEKKNGYGKWEVAWTWLPYFMAADSRLIKTIDHKMTELYRGQDTRNGNEESLLRKMHQTVVDLILERYQIKGLDHYLKAIEQVDPEG